MQLNLAKFIECIYELGSVQSCGFLHYTVYPFNPGEIINRDCGLILHKSTE